MAWGNFAQAFSFLFYNPLICWDYNRKFQNSIHRRVHWVHFQKSQIDWMTFQFVYLNPCSSCFKAVTTIINIDQWKFVFQPFFFFFLFLFLIKDEICVLPPGFQLLLARVLCSALSAFGKNSPDVVLVFLLCSGVTIDLYSFCFRYSTAQTQQYLQMDN